jgi:hypothetical protein
MRRLTKLGAQPDYFLVFINRRRLYRTLLAPVAKTRLEKRAAIGLPRLIVASALSSRPAARFEALHANRDEASPAAAAP